MPPEQTILAFDTSAAQCAAALLRGDTVLATRVEPMSRGQAERLMPMLEEMLAAHDLAWTDLNLIGVGVGPGNFTGIRISVAAARGLALGLGIRAVGVSTFEAASVTHKKPYWVVVDAPRDMAFAQHFGPISTPPKLIGHAEIPLLEGPILRFNSVPPQIAIENLARIAAAPTNANSPRPAPLYVRPADAAPPRDPAPVMLP